VQHHLGGLPFAQVAELTGGSVDAARKAASDGVQRLRILLSTEEDRP
jgi:DNA-directed RNA polymerase specialized sigma24 family protein